MQGKEEHCQVEKHAEIQRQDLNEEGQGQWKGGEDEQKRDDEEEEKGRCDGGERKCDGSNTRAVRRDLPLSTIVMSSDPAPRLEPV